MNNNGGDICYNVQIAVDEKNHMVVTVDAVSEPIDKEQLYNMASLAKENLNIDELTAIGDRGYYSPKQFEKCENDSIKVICTEANQAHHSATAEYQKDRFVFDEDQNCYVCPAGAILKPIQKWKNICQ